MISVSNQPNVVDWNLETGYNANAKVNTYPVRVYSAGKDSALEFKLQSFDTDIEYICRTSIPGFKIYLHTPGDLLKAFDFSLDVTFGEEVRISIKPKLITTSDGLRNYHIEQRKCFFNAGRQLRFFKKYTEFNCVAECLANFTLEKCGCVKFSMPSN